MSDSQASLCVSIAEVLGMSTLTRTDIGDLLMLRGEPVKDSQLREAVRYLISLGDLIEIQGKIHDVHRRGRSAASLRFSSKETLLHYVDEIPPPAQSPGLVHIDPHAIPRLAVRQEQAFAMKVIVKKEWSAPKVEPQSWLSSLLALQEVSTAS